MAEKKQEFQYGSAFLPEGEKKYSVIRWGWNGLNREDKIDTGQLTDMSGVLCDPPYMESVKKPKVWLDFEDGIPFGGVTQNESWVSEASRAPNAVPISIAGFDDTLYMVWANPQQSTPGTYEIQTNKFQFGRHNGALDTRISTFLFGTPQAHADITSPRSIVQFNVVTDPTQQDGSLGGNIVNYIYDRKTLVYPDCYSIPYSWESQGAASPFNDPNHPIPVSDIAAVYGSRVFGATENAVFSSAYNSYVDYSLDTADDVSSAHAWWSMAQSNTEADGAVTAIVSFENHIVIFRKDFMQLVYNNKNPFRVVDVGAFGCVSNKAWTILNGVLYFASQDKIYAFTGGTPKEISSKLEIDNFENAVLGSYNNTLWLQTRDDGLFTYKDGVWSKYAQLLRIGSVFYIIRQFATLDFGVVALAEFFTSSAATNYYKLLLLDWDENYFTSLYGGEAWEPEYMDSWYFVTDLMILGKLDIRRIKKVSLLCEGVEGSDVTVRLIDDEGSGIGTIVAQHTFDSDGIKVLRVLTRQFSGTMHKLRISGHGYVKIYAAEIKLSWGGDIYVTT